MKFLKHILTIAVLLSLIQCDKSSSGEDAPAAAVLDCVATPDAEGCAALLALTTETDSDDDGVADAVPDNCIDAANADQANQDGDAYGDVCDADIDADQKNNDEDNCEDVANISQEDADGDGLGDACDDDIDDDGVEATATDNCPYNPSSDLTDQDADGLGDVCDDDIDGDEIELSANDNCPYLNSTDQNDADGDGIGDLCEPDTDGDTVIDDSDNCDNTSNLDQLDTDNNGVGDECDEDRDGDGVLDAVPDNCLTTSNANQSDANADGEGDACDDDVDGDGTANADDSDDDGDGLNDSADLCAQHFDTWYYSVTSKFYSTASSVCSSAAEAYVTRSFAETITNVCVAEADVGPMTNENRVVKENRDMICIINLNRHYVCDYAYQKGTDWSNIDTTKASNETSFTRPTSCSDNTSLNYANFCGSWQQDSDGDGKGDACDARPTVYNRTFTTFGGSRSSGGTWTRP